MKSIILYFGSSVTVKLLPLLLLPLWTEVFEPAQYGKWILYLAILGFIEQVIMMSSQSFLAKDYYRSSDSSNSHLASTILALFSFNFSILLIVNLVLILVFNIHLIEKWWMFLLITHAFCNSIIQLMLMVYRCEDQPFNYAKVEVIKAIFSFGIVTILVVTVGAYWYLNVIVFFIGSIVALFIGGYLLPHSFTLMKVFLCEMLSLYKKCIPLLPYAISGIIISLSDRFFIDYYLTSADVGVYAVAVSLSGVFLVVVQAIAKYWTPKFHAQYDNALTKRKLFIHVFQIQLLIILLILLQIAVLEFFLYDFLINQEYANGKKLILPLSLSFMLYAMYMFNYPFFIKREETKIVGYISIFCSCLNLLGNYFLIPYFGLIGAVYSTLLSYFFMLIISFSYNFIKERDINSKLGTLNR